MLSEKNSNENRKVVVVQGRDIYEYRAFYQKFERAKYISHLDLYRAVQRTFQRLHLFIAPGGLLVFDVSSAAKLRALDGQVFLDETEDVYCVGRAEFEKRSQTCGYWMDIFTRRPDGAWDRDFEEHRQRAYEVEDLRGWLMEAGFTHVRTYGDCRMAAPRENEQRIYFTAIRGK